MGDEYAYLCLVATMGPETLYILCDIFHAVNIYFGFQLSASQKLDICIIIHCGAVLFSEWLPEVGNVFQGQKAVKATSSSGSYNVIFIRIVYEYALIHNTWYKIS